MTIDTGKPEWGAEEGKYYFVLKMKQSRETNEKDF
jgi:hypothetical protein